MRPTLLDKCDTVAPYIVRRMARSGRRAKTLEEIARDAGLSEATIKRYSRLRSWATIPMARAQAFAAACGHDLLRPRQTLKYLKWHARTSRGFGYLNVDAKRQFSKLLKRYGK